MACNCTFEEDSGNHKKGEKMPICLGTCDYATGIIQFNKYLSMLEEFNNKLKSIELNIMRSNKDQVNEYKINYRIGFSDGFEKGVEYAKCYANIQIVNDNDDDN